MFLIASSKIVYYLFSNGDFLILDCALSIVILRMRAETSFSSYSDKIRDFVYPSLAYAAILYCLESCVNFQVKTLIRLYFTIDKRIYPTKSISRSKNYI